MEEQEKILVKENEVNSFDYELPKRILLKGLLLGFIIFIIGFIFNFPLEETLDAQLKSILSANATCPINYDSLDLTLLPPKVRLNRLNIPGRCFQSLKSGPTFEKVDFKITSFGLFPPRLNTGLHTDYKKTTLDALMHFGFSQHQIEIRDSKIELSELLPEITDAVKLQGTLSLDMEMTLQKNWPSKAILFLRSDNFGLDSQNVQGIIFPPMNFGTFALKTSLGQKNILNIDTFLLGGETSPIRSSLGGTILLDGHNMRNSRLNLMGELAFDPSFLESFSILKLMLNQFPVKNGFYQVRLGGTLGMPQPSGI